jgi:hypothetical protein
MSDAKATALIEDILELLVSNVNGDPATPEPIHQNWSVCLMLACTYARLQGTLACMTDEQVLALLVTSLPEAYQHSQELIQLEVHQTELTH